MAERFLKSAVRASICALRLARTAGSVDCGCADNSSPRWFTDCSRLRSGARIAFSESRSLSLAVMASRWALSLRLSENISPVRATIPLPEFLAAAEDAVDEAAGVAAGGRVNGIPGPEEALEVGPD